MQGDRYVVVLPAKETYVGDALFATSDIQKHSDVVQMVRGHRLSRADLLALQNVYCGLQLPDSKYIMPQEDAVVYIDNSIAYVDLSFTSKNIPLWYRMNHMPKKITGYLKKNSNKYKKANVIIKEKKKMRTIIWKACVDIKQHQEIGFDYGEPDPSWSPRLE